MSAIIGTQTTAAFWAHHYSLQLYSHNPINNVGLSASLWPDFTMIPLWGSLDPPIQMIQPWRAPPVLLQLPADGSINKVSAWNVPHSNFSRGWLRFDRHNDAAFSAFGLEIVCIFSTVFKIRGQRMGNKLSWQFKQISAESRKLDSAHICP